MARGFVGLAVAAATITLLGLSALSAHPNGARALPLFHAESRTFPYEPGAQPDAMDAARLYYAAQLSRAQLEYRF